MDRASDYGSEGWGFESLRARNIRPWLLSQGLICFSPVQQYARAQRPPSPGLLSGHRVAVDPAAHSHAIHAEVVGHLLHRYTVGFRGRPSGDASEAEAPAARPDSPSGSCRMCCQQTPGGTPDLGLSTRSRCSSNGPGPGRDMAHSSSRECTVSRARRPARPPTRLPVRLVPGSARPRPTCCQSDLHRADSPDRRPTRPPTRQIPDGQGGQPQPLPASGQGNIRPKQHR